MSKTADRERPDLWEWLVVGLLATGWSLAIGQLAVARHLAFKTGYDLGTFAQVVWATAHGRPFYTSLTEGMTNFLGLHFTPLVAIVAPFYRIWPDARVLLIVQTIALASATLFLFSFARRRLGRGLALLVVVTYLLSPLVHYIALFDFHSIALAVPLLMAAGAALLDERPVATLIWLGLALLAKEEVALIAVGFGLYALFIQHRRYFGTALTVGAGLWAVLLFSLVMPSFNQSLNGYVFLRRYGALGETPGQMARTLLARPASVLKVLATEAKANFLWQLLAPFAALPLLGLPAVLLTVPTLAYLLLSDYEFQTSIRYHYAAPLVPMLFLATVIALQRLRGWKPYLGHLGGVALFVATLICLWWWSPVPGAKDYDSSEFAVRDADRAAHWLLASIPSDAAVASEWAFLPWLANRPRLDTLLSPPCVPTASEMPPEYLASFAPGPGAISAPLYPWIVEDSPGRPLRVPRFTAQATAANGLILWKRLGPQHDVTLARYDIPFQGGIVLVAAGMPPEATPWQPSMVVEPGTALPVWMAWGSRQPLDRRITFTLHLVDDDAHLVAQVDQEMGAGRFPTTLWNEWLEEPVVVGEFLLSIPATLPRGRYHLLASAYESETVIPLLQADGSQWFELATLEVDRTEQPSIPPKTWEAFRRP